MTHFTDGKDRASASQSIQLKKNLDVIAFFDFF